MARQWEVYLKVNGWSSDYQSVNNLLRYLKIRKIGSEASRDLYGSYLHAFCQFAEKLPDDLVAMKKTEIEHIVESYCDHKREKECSPRTVNVILSNLKTFFRVNGFKRNEEIEVESYRQPSRVRSRNEYVPTLDEIYRMADVAGSLRDRAVILFMVSTGLRNSTLRAILYGEVKEELEKGFQNVMIKVHAGMKKVVSSACKGDVEYCVFTSAKATEALRLYLDYRQKIYGQIRDDELLFPSSYNRVSHRERVYRPLTGRDLQVMIKKVAKRAGIKDWKNVTPHCLRKTFESVLRSRLVDGSRLDLKTQEYFMGHILAGSMDAYYDRSKVDELRNEYAKLTFRGYDEGEVKIFESLRVVAEALDIDCIGLMASKTRALGRDLRYDEKLQLVQMSIKEVIQQIKQSGTSGAEKSAEANDQQKLESERKLEVQTEAKIQGPENHVKDLTEGLEEASPKASSEPFNPMQDVFEHPIVKTRMRKLSQRAQALLIEIERTPNSTGEQLAAFLQDSKDSVINIISEVNRVFKATVIVGEGKPLRYRSLLKRVFISNVAKQTKISSFLNS